MDYDVALLVFGILLLLVGLVGKVRAKEIEVGTSSPSARVIIGLVGVGLISLSLFFAEQSTAEQSAALEGVLALADEQAQAATVAQAQAAEDRATAAEEALADTQARAAAAAQAAAEARARTAEEALDDARARAAADAQAASEARALAAEEALAAADAQTAADAQAAAEQRARVAEEALAAAEAQAAADAQAAREAALAAEQALAAVDEPTTVRETEPAFVEVEIIVHTGSGRGGGSDDPIVVAFSKDSAANVVGPDELRTSMIGVLILPRNGSGDDRLREGRRSLIGSILGACYVQVLNYGNDGWAGASIQITVDGASFSGILALPPGQGEA